jgi:pSer/pThr/pTyr-binding forkhead associated (FHA) protein
MAVGLEWVGTGQLFPLPLGRPVEIGRGPHADIQVADIHVNRRHCEAQWDGCRVWVRYLGSRNGTYLNGRPSRGGIPLGGTKGSLLRLGDVLHLCDVRLRLGTPSRVEDGPDRGPSASERLGP